MNLLAKLGMGERTRRNFVAILLVAAGGSVTAREQAVDA